MAALRLIRALMFVFFWAVLPAYADEGADLAERGMHAEAVAWWKQASVERQDHEAEFRLGDYYESGGVEPENFPEAAKWYLLAAEGGHAKAQSALASFYDAGAGVPQSAEKAAYWFRKCAEQNDPSCQLNLGRLSSDANDPVEAYKWYYLSAKNGFLEFNAPELTDLAARMTPEQKREAMQRAVAFKAPEKSQ